MQIFILIIIGFFISSIFIFRMKTEVTPKDFFFTIFHYALFYTIVISLMVLLSQYVNFGFPDVLHTADPYYYGGYDYFLEAIFGAIRVTTALLLVSLPLFIWTSNVLKKEYKIQPEKKELGLNKWLGYLTIFASSITAIISLVTLIYNFYGGELTVRFGLKVLVVFIISLAVFLYYRFDLKNPNPKTKLMQFFVWVLGIVVLISVIAGFFVVGSPNYQRALRLDGKRVENLSMFQSEIGNFWSQEKRLPNNYDELIENVQGYVMPVDPVTKEKYVYEKTSDLTYNLCANFTQTSRDFDGINSSGKPSVSSIEKMPYNESWIHDSGYVCFERKIKPDLNNFDGMMPVSRPFY